MPAYALSNSDLPVNMATHAHLGIAQRIFVTDVDVAYGDLQVIDDLGNEGGSEGLVLLLILCQNESRSHTKWHDFSSVSAISSWFKPTRRSQIWPADSIQDAELHQGLGRYALDAQR